MTDEPNSQIPLMAADLSQLSASEIIRLSALERKLMLLGLDSDSIRIFAQKYIDGHLSRAADQTRPTREDFDELIATIEPVLKEVQSYKGTAPFYFSGLKSELPGLVDHLRDLSKWSEASGKNIPPSHYQRVLTDLEDTINHVLENKLGNEAGTVLTQAPSVNYQSFFALSLLIELQQNPLERADDALADLLDDSDVELLDSAIKLGQPVRASETTPVRPRYSVKH